MTFLGSYQKLFEKRDTSSPSSACAQVRREIALVSGDPRRRSAAADDGEYLPFEQNRTEQSSHGRGSSRWVSACAVMHAVIVPVYLLLVTPITSSWWWVLYNCFIGVGWLVACWESVVVMVRFWGWCPWKSEGEGRDGRPWRW